MAAGQAPHAANQSPMSPPPFGPAMATSPRLRPRLSQQRAVLQRAVHAVAGKRKDGVGGVANQHHCRREVER